MDITFDSFQFLFTPTFFALAGGAIISVILATGLSMKGALALTANETPSLMRSLWICIVLAVLPFVAVLAGTLVLGPKQSLVLTLVYVALQLGVLMYMGRTGVLRAFFANILYNLFGGISVAVVLAAFGFGYWQTLGDENREKVKTLMVDLKTQTDKAKEDQLARMKDFQEESGDDSFEIRDVFFSESDSNDASTSGQAGPVTMDPRAVPVSAGSSMNVIPSFDANRQKRNPFVK